MAVPLSYYIGTVCTVHQAKVPLYEGDIPPIGRPDRYEELTWEPGRTHDHNLLMYLRAARYGVSDPDSIRSKDPYPDSESGSVSRRAKMTHKNRKKIMKVYVLMCWMFFFVG
jgi:hypothetical protein